jgi:hypothetical protein
MMGSNLAHAGLEGDDNAPADSGAPRRLRIRFDGCSWRLSEDGPDHVGGMFVSLASAVDFARTELRGTRRSYVVVELGVAERDAR